MWNLIKTHADQPEDKKQVRDIIRKNYKRNPKSTPRDELKYLKAEDRWLVDFVYGAMEEKRSNLDIQKHLKKLDQLIEIQKGLNIN